jgi:hypothetical protein
MVKQFPGMAVVAFLGMGFHPPARGSVSWLEAPKLFEQGVTQNLQLTQDRAAMELEVGELFEDDGPASGHSYQTPPNLEAVTQDTWIKKDLIIPNPQARAAFLVVLSDKPFDALIKVRLAGAERNRWNN